MTMFYARFSRPADASWLPVVTGGDEDLYELADVTDVCASAGVRATLLDVGSLMPVGYVDEAGRVLMLDGETAPRSPECRT